MGTKEGKGARRRKVKGQEMEANIREATVADIPAMIEMAENVAAGKKTGILLGGGDHVAILLGLRLFARFLNRAPA